MRALGRFLQFAGLAMLPLAVVLQLPSAITLGQMLAMAAAGFAVFWIGRLVEGYSR
jgi:hypothetical protein